MFALRRTMATMAAQSPLKQAGKVVCIGRNYAYELAAPDPQADSDIHSFIHSLIHASATP